MARQKKEGRVTAPGLEYRERADREIPVWVAPRAAVKLSFEPKTVNLEPLMDEPAKLVRRCKELQNEARAWIQRGGVRPPPTFNGKLGALVCIYRDNPKSTYTKLSHSTQRVYRVYLDRMERSFGDRRLDRINGEDLSMWHEVWSSPDDGSEHLKVAAAAMAIAVLKSAVRYGVSLRLAGCKDFQDVLKATSFERPASRSQVISRAEVVALRRAARLHGRASIALATALQFDGIIRLYDVIGQWVPLSDKRPSTVLAGTEKWIGPRWEDIGADMTLKITPTKTAKKTGRSTTIVLPSCPMVMEEFAAIPPERRTGPLIVSEVTGLPYQSQSYRERWRSIARKAGISDDKWARDLRASGNTEGREAGASVDDLARIAAHSADVNRRVYDRADVVAFERVAAARALKRTRDEQ